jgi:hypothetical protein
MSDQTNYGDSAFELALILLCLLLVVTLVCCPLIVAGLLFLRDHQFEITSIRLALHDQATIGIIFRGLFKWSKGKFGAFLSKQIPYRDQDYILEFLVQILKA